MREVLWATIVSLAFPIGWAQAAWTELEPGLELARFKTGNPTVAGDSVVTVVRVDPGQWEIGVYCVTEGESRGWRNAKECAAEHGLVVATNAGMFATDHVTHIGFLRSEDHVNSGAVNHYQSVAAFEPKRAELPVFRILDLDAPDISLDSIVTDYANVVQNLRLIKNPGENRWSQQEKMWSEAALGEDSEGRVLFIFCRSPYSMHDLNEILLGLPIDLVCAQHLEGGPEAQLIVRSGETETELVGSYETGFSPNDDNDRLWDIPNVIGVRRRGGPDEP